MPKIEFSRPQQLGFTLIELIVVITITFIMLGGGIAAYLRFNQKQQVLAVAKTIQTELREAQKRARVGDRPTGCTRLLEYRVSMTANSSQLVTTAVCANTSYTVATEPLTAGVTAEAAFNIGFKVLHGGVSLVVGNGTITIKNSDFRYQFQVKTGGQITTGNFL